jgi:hypothetical protein
MIGVAGLLLAMLLETTLYIVREVALQRPVPAALRRCVHIQLIAPLQDGAVRM